MFAARVKNWQRGAPDDRSTNAGNIKRRLADFRAGVYMQTLLRDPVAGLMHSMIYFGFLVLTAVTAVLEIDHQLPEDAKFLHGVTYQAYSFVGDAAGSSSWPASPSPSCAATCSGPTASASSPSRSTR